MIAILAHELGHEHWYDWNKALNGKFNPSNLEMRQDGRPLFFNSWQTRLLNDDLLSAPPWRNFGETAEEDRGLHVIGPQPHELKVPSDPVRLVRRLTDLSSVGPLGGPWPTLLGPLHPTTAIANHLRFARPSEAEALSYNVLQRLTYLFVIFVLFPLVIWTGLAMSPAFVSAVPATVTLLGGQQSARTIHFFVSLALVLFLLVHVVMVCLAGFRSRMRAMITGRAGTQMERT